MQQEQIFVPFLTMICLTAVVWLYMYIRRLGFLLPSGIDAQKVNSPEKLREVVPEQVNYSSDNLKNLFEMPVLFYALCLYLYVTAQVDPFYLNAAYMFVIGRALHSIIHCTYNKVMHRFPIYVLSSLALWAMAFRAAFSAF